MTSARCHRSLLLIAVGALACTEEAPPPPPPPAVIVAEVAPTLVTGRADFIGQTEAYNEVAIRPRVEGLLVSREFVAGQDISEGDLLFVIESDAYQAQMDRAAAELAQAEAELTRVRQERERTRALFDQDAISQHALDEAIAKQGVAAAKVQAARAAATQAKLDLDHTQLRSPIQGRVGRSAVDVGNLIRPDGTVLATVTQLDPLYVNVSISENLVLQTQRQGELAPEQEPEIGFVPRLKLSDGSMYSHAGRFDFLDQKVDRATGTVAARAVFPNPDLLLRPGQHVTVVVAREPVTELVIPQAAVQQDQAGRFVLVVGPDETVESRRVALGIQEGTGWVVEQGLEPGELVIVEGLQKVRPGVRVSPSRASKP